MKALSVPGRCRCGRLRFVLREEPMAFYLCHCTDCQAESGSAFGQSMLVRREAIDAVEGPALEHTIEHEAGRRGFVTCCGNCLTMLWGWSRVPEVRGLKRREPRGVCRPAALRQHVDPERPASRCLPAPRKLKSGGKSMRPQHPPI
jgi:hypothetical protein